MGFSFIHIAIGWNEQNLTSLTPIRQHAASEKAASFTETLRRQRIPTIWVSVLDECEIAYRSDPYMPWTQNIAPLRPKADLRSFGLSAVRPKMDEPLFRLSGPNIFSKPFSELLRGSFPGARLIMTGGPTEEVIAQSMIGADQNSFGTSIVSDQLFSLQGWDNDPNEHQAILTDEWREYAESLVGKPRLLRIVTTQEVRRTLASFVP